LPENSCGLESAQHAQNAHHARGTTPPEVHRWREYSRAGRAIPRGKLLGDTAAVTALLDRLLHHAHVLKCGPRSWRTKVAADLRPEGAANRTHPVSAAAGKCGIWAVDKLRHLPRPPRMGEWCLRWPAEQPPDLLSA
jgi:hypothetical protein